MNTQDTRGRRCGAATPTGPCGRRVRHEGDRCYLHPSATLQPGTTGDGTVAVVTFDWQVVTVTSDAVRVWLPERVALRLARDLQAFYATPPEDRHADACTRRAAPAATPNVGPRRHPWLDAGNAGQNRRGI